MQKTFFLLQFISAGLKRFNFFLILFVFAFADSIGQPFSVRASIDSNVILIGKQVKLTLELTQQHSSKIQWAAIPDTIGKVEVIEKSKIDSVLSSDSISIIKRQHLLLTCFDSGYYVIPPFRFTDLSNTDTLTNFAETQPLLLTVNTLAVDTTRAIKDIKAPVIVPLSWQDFLPWLIGLLLLVAIIIGVLYLRKRFKKKPVVAFEKPKRPAHEIALEELKKLEEEKLWQQGNFKYYHTRLTDIIRIYLWHRYDLDAMEMTSDEILSSTTVKGFPAEIFEKLKFMLTLADLVKFAKAIPVASENEQCLANGYDLIFATKFSELKLEEIKEAAL
ncbi:MAG: hypothetical protein ACHQNT_08050 [Bacteroidia bacterium]